MKFNYESEWKKAGIMCLSFRMGVSIGSEYKSLLKHREEKNIFVSWRYVLRFVPYIIEKFA